jgi:CheY-like chemotaxis protein
MKKILVVDDHQNILEIIEGYLESVTDYQVTTLDHSPTALKKVQEEDYDLLITDILMPEMNGIELIDQVRKIKPELRILACSGGGESGALVAGLALDQALSEGAAVALLKPFTQEELLAKVQQLIGL